MQFAIGIMEAREQGWTPALPAYCLRVLTSPRAECMKECPGLQPDGSCLTDIVRRAIALDVPWQFEVDKDGVWIYAGPPLEASSPA